MLLSCLLAVTLSDAIAAPASCQQYDSHGLCVVQVGTGGATAAPTQSTADTSNRGAVYTQSLCTFTASGAEVPCQDGDAWWAQSMQCYVKVLVDQPPMGTAVWGGHTDGAIYLCTFLSTGTSVPGTNGFAFWSATAPAGPPVVDPVALAQQALQSLSVPEPTPGRYPAGSLDSGQPFTVVNAYTWFWTDAASFGVLTARADAGGVSAEVTVTPTALSFTPGDGGATVSCPGPGVAWQPTDGVWAPSPAGCDYRYLHSSIHEPGQEVTAVYGIEWSVAWRSSTGASGTLPALTTTSSASFAVAEVQSVVTG
ncbi:hypothetical protein [Modestobacter altitudinis]|uniref:hypothetical protein n=1 Tax=Modestobacter altitudinis TaxID=2213158 RepID=UPI001FEA38D0|nr:hypothetical protein [Modestobacter altitudinis]